MTVTGPRLHKLVAILNRLATVSNGIGGCTADFGERATITMSFGGHQVVYTREFACYGVDVTADGKEQPGFGGATALDERHRRCHPGVRLPPSRS